MNWITGFTIIILVFGLMFGLVVSGLNPWKSPAEAELTYVQADRQRRLNEFEIEKQAAQTQAEIDRIEADKQAYLKNIEENQKYQQQLYAKKLTAYDRLVQVRDTLLLVLGLSMSGSLFLIVGGKVLVLYRTVPVQKQPLPRNVAAKQYWQRQIEMARANERLFRSTTLMEARLKSVRNSSSMTKEQRDKLPLAT